MSHYPLFKPKEIIEEPLEEETLVEDDVHRLERTSIIVSHIPKTVANVSLTGSIHSAESTISSTSKQALFDPLSRNADDELVPDRGTTAPWSSTAASTQRKRDSVGDSLDESANGHARTRNFTDRTTSSMKKRKPGTSAGQDSTVKKMRFRPALVPRSVPDRARLLSRPLDASVLSSLHTWIRQQIEVFEASTLEIAEPAPGRKNPIQVHQVGLRCIHCRHVPPRERVKRAVCYPTTVGRIYNSVSDMKFDHFTNCPSMPVELRQQFQDLKNEKIKIRDKKKRDGFSSSTAQYYHDAAREMGMVDNAQGVFMAHSLPKDHREPTIKPSSWSLREPDQESLNKPQLQVRSKELIHSSLVQKALAQHALLFMLSRNNNNNNNISHETVFKNRRLLARSQDSHHLNALHCLVRRHIEIFAATAEDVATPSPGRKQRIHIGQVGIRCVHCVGQRVKRAVCYPPKVSGIYHAVSNMKHDHFPCSSMSPLERAEFLSLKNTGRKSGTGSSSTTADYYHESAVALGLVDTEAGIRFQNDEENKKPVVMMDGISALMIAATDPSVRVDV